jgi:hypothetical protein
MKMKKSVLITMTLLLSLVFSVQPALAMNSQNQSQQYADLPLCMPGYYPENPSDCLPLGPSQTIKSLRDEGFPYPLSGMPAHKPEPSLSDLPIRVANVAEGQGRVYASLDEAINGGNAIRNIGGGDNRFVAIVEQAYSNGKNYVRLLNGGWMQADPHYSSPTWQGVEFFETPESNLGFTIDNVGSYSAASFSSPLSGITYTKFDAFPIYKTVEAEGYEWYQISPSEWMPSLKSRRVVIDTSTPPGVEGGKWINIDLHNQTLSAYENNELVFAAIVGTGSGELYSDPGTYQIYEKREIDQMQGAYKADRSDFFYYEGIPWAMYYNHAQAIHGIYWPTILGFKQSHGCVNMFAGDAHWLFNFANVGDYVYVHDPSGETPVPTPTPVGTPGQELIFSTPTPMP